MASVVTRCVRAMVAQLVVDSLAVVFPIWKTIAGKSRRSAFGPLGHLSVVVVSLVLVGCELWLRCIAWLPCVLMRFPRTLCCCLGEGFPQDYSVVVSSIVVLPQGLSFSQDRLALLLLAAVFSLKVCVVWSFRLCVLVKVLPRIALCHFWQSEVLPGRLLALLVDILPKAALCCLVVRFQVLGCAGGTSCVPVVRMVSFVSHARCALANCGLVSAVGVWLVVLHVEGLSTDTPLAVNSHCQAEISASGKALPVDSNTLAVDRHNLDLRLAARTLGLHQVWHDETEPKGIGRRTRGKAKWVDLRLCFPDQFADWQPQETVERTDVAGASTSRSVPDPESAKLQSAITQAMLAGADVTELMQQLSEMRTQASQHDADLPREAAELRITLSVERRERKRERAQWVEELGHERNERYRRRRECAVREGRASAYSRSYLVTSSEYQRNIQEERTAQGSTGSHASMRPPAPLSAADP
ncbi:hypothetical protein Taro_023976, partial [Colocasia esculenta]|nr:hypothetical protein [Colocasia esculenta]